jgi:hypothetical protein
MTSISESSTVRVAASSESSSSGSNVRSIIDDALANYARITGIDLSKNHFAAALEQADSPEHILQRLQERENAFKEVRDGNQGLTSILKPAVSILHAFSGMLGEAISDMVSHTCHLVSLLT